MDLKNQKFVHSLRVQIIINKIEGNISSHLSWENKCVYPRFWIFVNLETLHVTLEKKNISKYISHFLNQKLIELEDIIEKDKNCTTNVKISAWHHGVDFILASEKQLERNYKKQWLEDTMAFCVERLSDNYNKIVKMVVKIRCECK